MTAETVEEETKSSSRRKESCLEKTKRILQEKLPTPGLPVLIVAHPVADPDAIGSMMGLAWLLRTEYDAEVHCFWDNVVSHPQNRVLVSTLDPEMRHIDEFDPKVKYALTCCVDTIPVHAVGGSLIPIDLVIDHHKVAPNGGFKGHYLNLKAGSCAATVYQLIKAHGVEFDEDNDRDRQVSTAMMVSIRSDTEDFVSLDTTQMEFEAYGDLFKSHDPAALKEIIRYKIPKVWKEQIRAVYSQVTEEDVQVYGVGYLHETQRDLIAFLADLLQGISETSIVFAVIDGNRVEGSVRTTNSALNVPALCKALAGEHGDGGGKLGKGAYHYSLAGFAVSDTEDEAIKEKLWSYVRDREIKNILRTVKK